MKKILLTLVGVLVATATFAQSQINFDNRTTVLGYAATVFRPDGTTALVNNGTEAFVAQLYLAASPNTAAITEGPSNFRVNTTSLPGTWSGGIRNFIPSITSGQTVSLIVRVWDSSVFSSYDAAVSGGGLYGQSQAFNFTAQAPGTPAGNLTMQGFQSFALVPEPSTIALGALGIGALLMVRRRKA